MSTPLIHGQASGPSYTIIEIDEVQSIVDRGHSRGYPVVADKCGLSRTEHQNRRLDKTG
jgi:hypothetical protein